ncbi:MAG: hypothetical protein HC915_17335 [Anaerolineae bacterium]|nr:hypothetical protein [Anaerolineae bacterium]
MNAPSAVHRRTIGRQQVFDGRGIHTNAPSTLTISPRDQGDGIVLEMKGMDWPLLRLTASHAVAEESDRRTVMRGPEGQLFQQLEHVMAALAGARGGGRRG